MQNAAGRPKRPLLRRIGASIVEQLESLKLEGTERHVADLAISNTLPTMPAISRLKDTKLSRITHTRTRTKMDTSLNTAWLLSVLSVVCLTLVSMFIIGMDVKQTIDKRICRSLPIPSMLNSTIFQPTSMRSWLSEDAWQTLRGETTIYRTTAFCSCAHCCGRWSDGITASGSRATKGRTIAADPKLWAIGTCLSVAGLGERIVEDTGSAIKGARLDVYFDSHREALRWGVRWLHVREC